MNPFDYVNSINSTKKDLMVDDLAEKAYDPFLTNRALSQFMDTVLWANAMNRFHHLDKKLQYHFLINSIRKGKRFGKWPKAENPEHLEIVKEYYGYSNEKARDALRVLTPEHINELKKKVYKGGTTRTSKS